MPLISAGLRAAFPDVPLITEEQAASHALTAHDLPHRRSAGRHQGIRPAPRRFHREHRLCRERRADRAASSMPPRRGGCSTPCPTAPRSRKPAPSPRTPPARVTPLAVARPDNAALMVVASKSHRDQATDDYIARYAVRDMTIAGSVAEVLPGRHRRGRSLPPPWPHDGMGHRRR